MWCGAWKKQTPEVHQKASANAIGRFYNNERQILVNSASIRTGHVRFK
jgi:hypothetical protein